MNINDMLLAAGTSAITLLADLQPREDLVCQGAEARVVDAMHALRAVYYGPTQSTRKQREARQFATINQLGFDRLGAIERAVGRLHDSSKSWALRRDLARFNGGRHDFARHVRAKLADYNSDAPAPESSSSCSFTHHAGTNDASLHVRASSDKIREIQAKARAYADDNDVTMAKAVVDIFMDSTGDGTHSQPEYRIKVLVTLDDIARIINGEGADVLVQTTTGAVMTGTELMRKRIDAVAEYIGLTPVNGAISLAHGASLINDRTSLAAEQARRAREGVAPIPQETVDKATARHGTYKDRCLQEANQTVCAAENCSVPVAWCELNHNIAYSQGGLSLLSNTCLLCPYHNGKAGAEQRYTTIRGRPYQILPTGKLVRNKHPLARSSPVEKILAPALV